MFGRGCLSLPNSFDVPPCADSSLMFRRLLVPGNSATGLSSLLCLLFPLCASPASARSPGCSAILGTTGLPSSSLLKVHGRTARPSASYTACPPASKIGNLSAFETGFPSASTNACPPASAIASLSALDTPFPSASDIAWPSASDARGVVDSADPRCGFVGLCFDSFAPLVVPFSISDDEPRRLRRRRKNTTSKATRSSPPSATPTPIPILEPELLLELVLLSETAAPVPLGDAVLVPV